MWIVEWLYKGESHRMETQYVWGAELVFEAARRFAQSVTMWQEPGPQ